MAIKRKFPFSRGLLAAALSVGLMASAHAQQAFQVRDIQINGVQRVDPGLVFSHLPVKVGDTFSEAQTGEAIQRLYASGLFSDVSVRAQGDVLVVDVVERPTIASINFNGMREFDAPALTKALAQVGFGEGRVFDRSMLERAEFELKQQYLSKGKYSVEINPIITPLPRNRVGVSFEIFEGDLARIRKIEFVGNEVFSSGRLEDELELTTSGFMTWYTGTDKYSREKLEGDVERLRSFYLDRGYLEFSSEPPQVSISPDRQDIFVTYTLHEGKPYKVRNVGLAGDLLGLDDQIGKLIRIKEGETFSASRVNETVKAITEYLGSLGYAFANVNPSPQVDSENLEADVTFFVDPGSRVYVRRIQIGGNTRTRDEVVRREFRQQEAAWYDGDAIKLSRDRVDRLGYFNDVNVSTAPVAGTTDQIDINVDVKEKPTGLLNLGVGYGSTDKLMLTAGISQSNIFGSGNNMSVQLNTSKTNRTASITHTNPYWTHEGISKTTALYYRRSTPRENTDAFGQWRVTAFGGGLNFGVPISEYDRIFMGVNFEHNKLSGLTDPIVIDGITYQNTTPRAYEDFIDAYGEGSNALIFNVGWSKDTRDSATTPNRGHYTRLSADFSTMDLRYYMFSAQHQHYIPLSRGITLALNGSIDWGRTYGGNKPFPVIKNLYAGGIGSVRGYEGASLGPRDTRTNDFLGGSRRIIGNVQLYLPFPGATRDRTLRWFVFGDIGQVTNTGGQGCALGIVDPNTGLSHTEDPCGWKYSAGVGFSWDSPMGPLQLSFARALNAKRGDEKQAFQFQIGTSF